MNGLSSVSRNLVCVVCDVHGTGEETAGKLLDLDVCECTVCECIIWTAVNDWVSSETYVKHNPKIRK